MSKIKVSIIGACVSRDTFTTRHVPEYKTWYEVVGMAFQTSVISIMTDALKLTNKECENTCAPSHKKFLTEEISKVYIEQIINSSPDYIIIDLYSDIRSGLVKIRNTYITNSNIKIRRTNLYKEGKYDEIITYHKDKERYIELIDKYFDKFIKIINKKLPRTRVILLKSQYAYSYIDDDNTIRYMDRQKFHFIDRENNHWRELTEYVATRYNLEVLDMTKREYFADPNYPFGFSPWHYENQYYQDFIKEFNSICLRDILEEKNKSSIEKFKRYFRKNKLLIDK